jgi:hypothetical protein
MSQREILEALADGWVLKSRRELNGNKEFVLQFSNDQPKIISPKMINRLREKRLIDSNKKFPVSTFWLTDLGQEIVKDKSKNL